MEAMVFGGSIAKATIICFVTRISFIGIFVIRM